MIRFCGYQLDPVQGLTRGGEEIRITPKSLSLLRVLAQRSGQIVTKDDLFRLVWADTAVSDAALTSCIQELRHALHDDARNPRVIETVHRRGYRFLPPTSDGPGDIPAAPTGVRRPREPLLVGREDVIEQLLGAFERAAHASRQTVFITGEPGVGKTTIVDAFLARIAAQGVRSTWSQCVEHYGVGEPYQPLLDALARLCRQSDGDATIASLERHAPTWLAQLPGLLAPERLEALQRTTAGTTRERMLRELTGTLEAITSRVPLVLWLDDLHWSDASTLDWITAFAQRPEPARVLLVGTFRPSALVDRREPLAVLADTLHVKGFSRQVAVDGLDEEAIAEYATLRFPAAQSQTDAFRRLARVVHRHTAGNPLFATNVLNDLVARRLLREQNGVWTLDCDPDSVDL